METTYKPKYYIEPDYVLSELKKNMLIDGFDFVLDLNSSHGGHFVEARTGNKFLDFFTCFASMPIGMNHPKMMDENFICYLGKAALNKPSNSDIYTEVMATFVKTFYTLANINKFKYSFFIDGGALAVENALKTAFDWKVRKNFLKGYKEEKGHQIMHFQHAFHGRSGYTMSLTNTDPNKILHYPKFQWPRISSPFMEFPLNNENLQNVIARETQAINEMKTAFKNNKDDIAAIIIEPIQGEGGDLHFRNEFMQELRNLADENEALLIFDEVQTGVGVTGKWWAHQHTDIVPDIMVFGKKMQVCGILATDRIDDIPNNVFNTSSRINSTWGGNLVDMARSTRYLEIIDEDNLIENSANMGAVLLNHLNNLADEYPQLIKNIRGKGLFCAFDLPDSGLRNQFRENCFEKGLIILGCGGHSIRFRPPLNINEREIESGVEIIRDTLKKL
jgi:L-lysine 6-transaminase